MRKIFPVLALLASISLSVLTGCAPQQAPAPVQPPAAVPAPAPAPMAPTPVTEAPVSNFQPGPSVTVAKYFQNQGEVSVLQVKRIMDPYTKLRNVVNVQLRIKKYTTSRRDLGYKYGLFHMSQTAARDPDTSQVFKTWDGKDDLGKYETQYSSLVNFNTMAPGSSADVYAWFFVPEHVRYLNIYPDNSGVLENLEIQQ